ncbi:MAG: LicD family protein, partial [Raoultibacter sp.]
MQKISIDEMKQIELEIMDEFDRICREHGFSYCLGYGSCLGAIRHKGFIPWDDDMDVVMPRADYERFIKEFNVL